MTPEAPVKKPPESALRNQNVLLINICISSSCAHLRCTIKQLIQALIYRKYIIISISSVHLGINL